MVLTRSENVQVTLENVHKLLDSKEILCIDPTGNLMIAVDTGKVIDTTTYKFDAVSAYQVRYVFQRRLDAGSSI